LEYMYLSGYDPAATISFFEKLQAKESTRKVSSLFASHPPTPDRVEAEKKNIEGEEERWENKAAGREALAHFLCAACAKREAR